MRGSAYVKWAVISFVLLWIQPFMLLLRAIGLANFLLLWHCRLLFQNPSSTFRANIYSESLTSIRTCSVPIDYWFTLWLVFELIPFLSIDFLKMAANTQNRAWCSKCNAFRDSESFGINKFGRKQNLCNRHKTLAPRTRELAIDATFDTNNMGMHLYAVLA